MASAPVAATEPAPPPPDTTPTGTPVTVCITRRVKAGREAEFERALHEFVQQSLALPGQLGVHITRPAEGSHSREYGVVRKFASRAALDHFRQSALYLDWQRQTRQLTEGEPRFDELNGLESWFTLPGQVMRPFPKWKMAIATFLGVFPVAALLNLTLAPLLRPLNFWLANALFNGCVVIILTWLVMPNVTRLLARWLNS